MSSDKKKKLVPFDVSKAVLGEWYPTRGGGSQKFLGVISPSKDNLIDTPLLMFTTYDGDLKLPYLGLCSTEGRVLWDNENLYDVMMYQDPLKVVTLVLRDTKSADVTLSVSAVSSEKTLWDSYTKCIVGELYPRSDRYRVIAKIIQDVEETD